MSATSEFIKSKMNKEKCYMVTKSQLDKIIKDKISVEMKNMEQEAFDNAVNTTMVLLLGLPLEVLKNHYWKKSYDKKIPGFTEHILDYYKKWQNGELNLDDIREDLWNDAGVRLEVEDGK